MTDLVRTHKVQPPPEMRANELGINFQTGKLGMAMATTCGSVRDLMKGRELPTVDKAAADASKQIDEALKAG
jgi:hypothetical protein